MIEARNVEFEGYKYAEEVGAELPVFTLKEPTIEDWNDKARRQNIKMYISIIGRLPKDYDEVRAWIYSFENDESRTAGTVTAN